MNETTCQIVGRLLHWHEMQDEYDELPGQARERALGGLEVVGGFIGAARAVGPANADRSEEDRPAAALHVSADGVLYTVGLQMGGGKPTAVWLRAQALVGLAKEATVRYVLTAPEWESEWRFRLHGADLLGESCNGRWDPREDHANESEAFARAVAQDFEISVPRPS